MIDTYTIKSAYPYENTHEIEIKSEGLLFTELGVLSGCQTNNLENSPKIHDRCIKIVKLIREIEALNIKK